MHISVIKAFFLQKSSPVLGFDVVFSGGYASIMLCGCRLMGGKIHMPGVHGERKKFFQHGLLTPNTASALYSILCLCLRDVEQDPLKLGPDRFRVKILPYEEAVSSVMLTRAAADLFPEKGVYTISIPDPAEKNEEGEEEEDEYVVGS